MYLNNVFHIVYIAYSTIVNILCFLGHLPAVCVLRHLWTYYALPEDQSGLLVLSPEALTVRHSRLISPVTCNSHFFLYQVEPWFNIPPNVAGNEIAALSQMSWLMKTAAIELRVTSLNRQRSHTQRLLNLLLDDQPHMQHAGITAAQKLHVSSVKIQ